MYLIHFIMGTLVVGIGFHVITNLEQANVLKNEWKNIKPTKNTLLEGYFETRLLLAEVLGLHRGAWDVENIPAAT